MQDPGCLGPGWQPGEEGLQLLTCSVAANSHELGTVPVSALENNIRKGRDFLFSTVCAARVDLAG